MKDYLVKGFAYNGTVRIFAARTTNLVAEAQTRHQMWPTSTQALGRALTATVIQGSFYKEDQTITVRIDGGGPIGKIITFADADGHVRGYLENTKVNMIYEKGPKKGQSAVGQAVGTNGFIHITKDLRIRDMFTGSAPLQTGEIAEDFTYFFALSEQIPSSVGLGVVVDTDNTVKVAGGFILQIMPGYKKEDITRIEEIIKNMKPIGVLLEEGKTPEDIIDILSDGEWQRLLDLDLYYQCDCSKEKFERGLLTLPMEDLEEILKDEITETNCQFCQEKYHFTQDDIERLIKEKENAE
ncbi:Hsp33 family molecular chaperone HslO [Mycoplasmatota bacterium zrk1]